jgi:hypothetical protein
MNQELDSGEVGVDCGGSCPVCSAYLDVEVKLQGLTFEQFLSHEDTLKLVMADLAAVGTNRVITLLVRAQLHPLICSVE